MKTKSLPSPNIPPTCSPVGRFSVAQFPVEMFPCQADMSIPRSRPWPDAGPTEAKITAAPKSIIPVTRLPSETKVSHTDLPQTGCFMLIPYYATFRPLGQSKPVRDELSFASSGIDQPVEE